MMFRKVTPRFVAPPRSFGSSEKPPSRGKNFAAKSSKEDIEIKLGMKNEELRMRN